MKKQGIKIKRQPAPKWTLAEDERLLRQIKSYPHNLSKCFHIVAEEIGRSPKAVEQRWYYRLSKDPRNIAFIMASPCATSYNKKNALNGSHEMRVTVWRRILNLLRRYN